jgi:hypothetical protein
MTVDGFLRRVLWWAVLVSPLALVFLLDGNPADAPAQP